MLAGHRWHRFPMRHRCYEPTGHRPKSVARRLQREESSSQAMGQPLGAAAWVSYHHGFSLGATGDRVTKQSVGVTAHTNNKAVGCSRGVQMRNKRGDPGKHQESPRIKLPPCRELVRYAALQNPISAAPSGLSRSFSNARSRICLIRSRVTPIRAPIFSSVIPSDPSSKP